MKKFKKILKISLIVIGILFASLLVTGATYYFAVTSAVILDETKLEIAKISSSLQIVDKNNNIICPTSENYIAIEKLSTNTKNAFICAEDKRFYSHSGIDFVRVGGAIVSNLKSKSFSEGASTISQQLIKNTHLSNEKTISRKLKEFKLTKELEKKYSKAQILELYLNNIYFGNGCYGIENAANHYFSKSAEKLSLSESAMLAGTINAPSVYDIQNNTEKAIKRRNLILELMHKYGKISEEQMNLSKQEEVNLKITKLSNNNFVYNEIIEEACKILGKTENQIKNNNIKIETYFDNKLQAQISKDIVSKYNNLESSPEIASIVIDNNTNGIVAIVGSKKTFMSKKQPGSAIKPILVYSPAIEQNIISPATKILDEKVNFGGYSPENADKKEHGYVSVREALKNSYNIPAVKLLNEIGINNAQEFAKKLGIDFSEQDNNLAIALGGFTEGISLKTLCDAYSTYANNGNYAESKYISKITSGNKVLYERKSEQKSVMSDSTAYLITNILQSAATGGTAKRLKDIGFEIASKTGTVGLSSSSKNSEAYNLSYTTKHTILTYFGGKIMPENINGATYPTMLVKDIVTYLYKENKPSGFKVPNSVEMKKISKADYEKNIVSLTDNEENGILEYFAKSNLPKKSDSTLSLKLEAFNFENKKPILSFFACPNYSYSLHRISENSDEIIFNENNTEASKIIKFEDITANSNEIYEYYAEICEKSSGKIYKTNPVKLRSF